MNPSDIERTKLFANSLDRASTACFTVGIATPLAGYVYNFANFGTSIDGWRFTLGIAAWLSGAIALHYLARRVLGALDE
ncbi:MAG: hypothetical protein ABL879_04965 [Devosia sp.]